MPKELWDLLEATYENAKETKLEYTLLLNSNDSSDEISVMTASKNDNISQNEEKEKEQTHSCFIAMGKNEVNSSFDSSCESCSDNDGENENLRNTFNELIEPYQLACGKYKNLEKDFKPYHRN